MNKNNKNPLINEEEYKKDLGTAKIFANYIYISISLVIILLLLVFGFFFFKAADTNYYALNTSNIYKVKIDKIKGKEINLEKKLYQITEDYINKTFNITHFDTEHFNRLTDIFDTDGMDIFYNELKNANYINYITINKINVITYPTTEIYKVDKIKETQSEEGNIYTVYRSFKQMDFRLSEVGSDIKEGKKEMNKVYAVKLEKTSNTDRYITGYKILSIKEYELSTFLDKYNKNQIGG